MNYVTEARRLGIRHRYNDLAQLATRGLDVFENIREDGLCISGCTACRQFRNDVQAALAAEAAEASEAEERIAESEANILAWLEEESHLQDAIAEVLDHVELLPESDLRSIATDAISGFVGAIRLAFMAEVEAQQKAHAELVGGDILAGATIPGPDRLDVLAAMFGGVTTFFPEDYDDDSYYEDMD